MRQLFYYKMRQKFITKFFRFSIIKSDSFITKCDSFITKCYGVISKRHSYYKMPRLLKKSVGAGVNQSMRSERPLLNNSVRWTPAS